MTDDVMTTLRRRNTPLHLSFCQVSGLARNPGGPDRLAGENIVEIYDTFERYERYIIGALAVVAAIVITHRVRRGRAERTA
jgi:hypothetical protein